MRIVLVLVVACALLPWLAHAQKVEPRGPVVPPTSTRTPEATQPGRGTPVSGQVYIAEAPPDFELESTTGERVKLSSMRYQPLVLLFADRRTRLDDLGELAKALEPSNVRVVAVIHENLQALQSHTHRAALPYVALADPTGEIAGVYGLWNSLEASVRPGLVMLDRSGLVRFMFAGQHLPADEIQKLVQFATEGL